MQSNFNLEQCPVNESLNDKIESLLEEIAYGRQSFYLLGRELLFYCSLDNLTLNIV